MPEPTTVASRKSAPKNSVNSLVKDMFFIEIVPSIGGLTEWYTHSLQYFHDVLVNSEPLLMLFWYDHLRHASLNVGFLLYLQCYESQGN